MAIEFLKQCEKEILNWPEEIREDLADALARLERGHLLSCLYLGQCPASVQEYTNYDSGIVQVFSE